MYLLLNLPQGRDQQSPPFRAVLLAEELVQLRRLLHGPGSSASASGAARGPGRADGLTGRARAASPRLAGGRRLPPGPRRLGGGAGGRAGGDPGTASSARAAPLSRSSLRGSAAAREPGRPPVATSFRRGAGRLLGRLLLLCLGPKP